MHMNKLILLIFLLLPALSIAQTNRVSKHHKAKYFEPAQELNKEEFIQNYFDELGLEKPTDLTAGRQFVSRNGWVRNRYKQEYKGLEVVGSSFVIHEQHGMVKKLTGNVFPDLDISTQPSQSKSAIEHSVINTILNSSPESTEELIAIKEDFRMESMDLKIMDKAYPNFSGAYNLVYELIAERNIPTYDRLSYFVDAHTGEVFHEISHVCEISVEGEANTRYYGVQKIITDSIAPNRFQMFDEGRNIRTLNANDRQFSEEFNYGHFEDSDNFWDNANEDLDEVAGDAHYCTAAYHDFMNDRFGWKGVDGLGTEESDLVSIVHINGRFYLNAFWNGVATHYGNGLCADYGPLTTLDVVAHEFAHAFTQFSSGLIYSNESGALNEGTSDIIGKAVEYAYDPDNFNWLIGDRFTVDEGEAFRNMSDPNDKGHPKYYQGENWSPFGAVHTNSGVYNYWYYLLVEGGTDTNEGGYTFNVPAIGWEDATDIVFGAQVGYYQPSTGYRDAYRFTLEYVEDVFGANSTQYDAVKEAWRAVGVTGGDSGPTIGGAVQADGITTTICTDECMNITLDLVNLSNSPVEASTSFILRYLLDGDITATEVLVLDQDLNVGDTLEFTFDRQLCWSDISGGQDFVQAEISVDDGDTFKEIGFDFVNLNDGAPKDINFTRFELTNNVCNSDFFSLQYRFENEGCEIIPVGTPYELIINVDGNEQIETRTLNADARPSVGQIFLTNLNLDVPLDFVNNYTVELRFDDDPNLSNNTQSGVFQTFEIMEEDNVERFTNYESDLSKWVFVNDAFFLFSGSVEYLSNQKLIVGSAQSFFEFNQPQKCETPEDFFLSQSFITKTNLDICYSTADMEDPVLRFEYIPFYSEQVEGLTPEFTSLHQVYLPSTDEILPMQTGFPEGVEQTLTYDLPMGSGELNISVLCNYGNEFDIVNGDFSNGDYQLFDNIRIEERGTTSTKDESIAQDITVYPNPAHAEINFEDAKQRPYNLSVYSIDGRKVHTQAVSNGRYRWNPDQTLNGLFMYKMEFEDGRFTNGKFVLGN